MAIGNEGRPTTSQLVEQLDGGNPYYLVILAGENDTGAIAAIDAVQGNMMVSARLEAVPHTLPIDKRRALELANFPEPATARLVWKASRASLSPLYPIWQVTNEAASVYVTQSGKVYNELSPAGPG